MFELQYCYTLKLHSIVINLENAINTEKGLNFPQNKLWYMYANVSINEVWSLGMRMRMRFNTETHGRRYYMYIYEL